MAQCSAKTKDGIPCQIPTRKGGKYCHVHRRQRMWRWILSAFGIGAAILGWLGFVANVTGVLSYFGINPVTFLPSKSINQNKPFESFELIIGLPELNTGGTATLSDYDTIVNTLAFEQVDTDITIDVQFLSARLPFKETLYFTSILHDLRVYIVPYDSEKWKAPPTWHSYGLRGDTEFYGPAFFSRNQDGKNLLSIRAERNDLAQLGPEVSMRSIEGWDVEMGITWEGPTANTIYPMMDSGSQMEWIRELPAVIKINGIEIWHGMLSQARGAATLMPYKVDRGGTDVWKFTKYFGTDPRPSSDGK